MSRVSWNFGGRLGEHRGSSRAVDEAHEGDHRGPDSLRVVRYQRNRCSRMGLLRRNQKNIWDTRESGKISAARVIPRDRSGERCSTHGQSISLMMNGRTTGMTNAAGDKSIGSACGARGGRNEFPAEEYWT